MAAQELIKPVYHRQQLGAPRSFEETLPAAVLAAQVQTYLDQSRAPKIDMSVIWLIWRPSSLTASASGRSR